MIKEKIKNVEKLYDDIIQKLSSLQIGLLPDSQRNEIQNDVLFDLMKRLQKLNNQIIRHQQQYLDDDVYTEFQKENSDLIKL